ncbi:MAG: hypothetical protein ABSG64_09885 [Solirubrobacteraceae bacterium]
MTGMVVLAQRRTRTYTGSLADLERTYARVLTHNLLLGWWGIPFAIIWTPIALVGNRKALTALRELAGPGI